MAQTQRRPSDDAVAADGRDGSRAQSTPTGDGLVQQLVDAVPDRPRLAPGVKLAGQMRESAFVDPPWLIEREGQGYVQVTELLYRIAERCDGQHTLSEIARGVSEQAGRSVSEDNVRQLVATQLLVRGLVIARNGKVIAAANAGMRSPLQINKMKMIDPRTLDGITRALQVLYWPPVLLLVLGIATVAQGWLYARHGFGGGIHDALYVPGFMAIVLLVIVISAGFHELGHAAALRYAGGTVRGMGAGMYLIYPAFYTDVSDNYRLARWARVRTDLGGFYFNLLFVLGLFALYAATRQELLLVLVLLINFEIVHQLLPFLRLDGYWTLADLTGIPDFFSQMGAFVRGALPVKRWKGRKLPALKWWAKAVFAVYVLVTIPALIFLTIGMLRGLPRVLVTTWDAVGQQGQSFAQAQQSGQVLGMAGSAGQVLLLAFPVVAIGYSVFNMGRGGLAALWAWSKHSAGRKMVAGLGVLAAVALLAVLWLPQLPTTGQPSPLYHPDMYRPIAQGERLSVGDAAGVVVVERDAGAELPWITSSRSPTPTGMPAAEATATTVATGTAAAATPTAVVTPTAAATAGATQAPVQAPTATAQSATSTPRAAAPVGTATPGACPTPTRAPTPQAGTPTATPAAGC